jgi:hypothetical protein
MNKIINIVLVLRTGGDFSMKDVYLLITHLRAKWESESHCQITVLTDAVQEKQELMGFTLLPFPVASWKGWWSKMNLFSPELKNLRPYLYMDLDTAVIGNVAKLIPDSETLQNSLIMLEDFYRPRHAASGVMWIPNNRKTDLIWNKWIERNAIRNPKRFRGDQDFIGSVTSPDTFWQRLTTSIVSFKPLPRPIKWRMIRPSETVLCCFHGNPRIPEAVEKVDWVKKYMRYEE